MRASASSPATAASFIVADCSRSRRRCLPSRPAPVQPLFTSPPESICILRLSALGDVCHALPVVRTLQDTWPQTRLTWIIGKLEHKLLGHLPDIEFIVFDKKTGAGGYRALRERLAGRRFDALLHMQLALRASLAAALVPARWKVGFDRVRAREAQWLFTNDKVAPRQREHVLDSLFGFAERLGVTSRSMRWDIPLPEAALEYASRAIPDADAADAGREPVLEPRVAQLERGTLCGARRPRRHASRHGSAAVRRPQRPRAALRPGHRALHAPAVPRPDRPGHAARVPRDLAARDGARLARLGTGAHGDHDGNAGRRPLCRHESAAQRPLLQSPVVRGPLRGGCDPLPQSLG